MREDKIEQNLMKTGNDSMNNNIQNIWKILVKHFNTHFISFLSELQLSILHCTLKPLQNSCNIRIDILLGTFQNEHFIKEIDKTQNLLAIHYSEKFHAYNNSDQYPRNSILFHDFLYNDVCSA